MSKFIALKNKNSYLVPHDRDGRHCEVLFGVDGRLESEIIPSVHLLISAVQPNLSGFWR